MKLACAIVTFFAVFRVASAASKEAEAKFKAFREKYADFDVDQVLKSERLLNNYIACILNEGKCTSVGEDLKVSLPSAFETGCHKCEPKEKKTVDSILIHTLIKRPKDWERIRGKYDPEKKYTANYEYILKKKKS